MILILCFPKNASRRGEGKALLPQRQHKKGGTESFRPTRHRLLYGDFVPYNLESLREGCHTLRKSSPYKLGDIYYIALV